MVLNAYIHREVYDGRHFSEVICGSLCTRRKYWHLGSQLRINRVVVDSCLELDGRPRVAALEGIETDKN